MAKSTRTPMEKFFAESLKWATARDKARGMVPNITIDFLVALYHQQDGLCIHTGWNMSFERGTTDHALCTIDRIDNTKGYTMDNVNLCRWDINKMRGDMPLAQFKALMRACVERA